MILRLALFAFFVATACRPAEAKDPAPFSSGAVTLSKEEAATLKAFTCNEFESKAHDLIGKVIKLKFTYRDKDVRESSHYEDTLVGELQYYIDSSRKRSSDSGWGFVDVLLPKSAAAWFTRIPTNIDARATLFVVGRVSKETNTQNPVVILMGSNIRSDSKGTHVSW